MGNFLVRIFETERGEGQAKTNRHWKETRRDGKKTIEKHYTIVRGDKRTSSKSSQRREKLSGQVFLKEL